MVDCIYERLDLENVSITRRKTAEMFGPATQVIQSLMPLIQIAIVLWAAETILTMLIKEHRKSKK